MGMIGDKNNDNVNDSVFLEPILCNHTHGSLIRKLCALNDPRLDLRRAYSIAFAFQSCISGCYYMYSFPPYNLYGLYWDDQSICLHCTPHFTNWNSWFCCHNGNKWFLTLSVFWAFRARYSKSIQLEANRNVLSTKYNNKIFTTLSVQPSQ